MRRFINSCFGCLHNFFFILRSLDNGIDDAFFAELLLVDRFSPQTVGRDKEGNYDNNCVNDVPRRKNGQKFIRGRMDVFYEFLFEVEINLVKARKNSF